MKMIIGMTFLGASLMANTPCEDLTGRIVLPSSPEYNEDRLVSNYYTSKDKFPKAIVYCKSKEDVQNAVKWARCQKVPIRIRSGGHCHEAFSTGNDVLVIDVSEMKEIQVDKDNKMITIQPGLNNKELYTRLYQEGLTHAGGTCSEVGLSGLVLSGGIGPLYRREGLTCDTLLELELVDANGNLIRATKDNEHKDLFWACRGGGGGNFGVLVSMTMKVYPAEPITWFNIGWDWNEPIDKVIETWQDFMTQADRRWFSHLDIWAKAFPTAEFKKQPVKALGFFWGSADEAKQALAPLLKIGTPKDTTIETVTWLKAIELIEDSTAVFITSQPEYKSPGAYAKKSLPPQAIKIIHQTLSETTSPLFNLLLFSLGGAAKEVDPTATAYYHRDAEFFLNYTIQWLDKNEDKKQISEVDSLRSRLLPYSYGDYIGNPDLTLKDYLTIYYGSNVQKLQAIKKKYDPDNVFHYPQSIPPG